MGKRLSMNGSNNLKRNNMKLINKDVHEHYCSLEMLQLLYDKGMRYREWTDGAFTHNSLAEHRFNQGDVSHLKDTVTHQIVVEWLRVNHGIWIGVSQDWDEGALLGYEALIETEDGESTVRTKSFNTPQEATEDGIFYVLNKLI
jgi:hypothetical protein